MLAGIAMSRRSCRPMIATSSISRSRPAAWWVVFLIMLAGCLFAVFYAHIL